MFSDGTCITKSDVFNVRYTYTIRDTHKWAQDSELLRHEYISNFLRLSVFENSVEVILI